MIVRNVPIVTSRNIIGVYFVLLLQGKSNQLEIVPRLERKINSAVKAFQLFFNVCVSVLTGIFLMKT